MPGFVLTLQDGLEVQNFLLAFQDDIITGAKLPSKQQVLSYFLYQHLHLKEIVRTTASATVEKLEDFWNRARIPLKHIVKKVEKLFAEWQALKRNANHRSEMQMKKEQAFKADFNDIFDVAHADALTLIKIAEDREFLVAQ